MFSPLKHPNLPQGKVTHAAVSNYNDSLINKLSELDIEPVITVESDNLDKKINYHTDMLLFNLGNGLLLADESQKDNLVKFLTIGYKCRFINNRVKSPYPSDSLLNAVILGSNIICNNETVCGELIDYAGLNGFNIISVNQGYTKCSVCIVSDDAVITDDESVYKTLIKNDIDTLYISKGSVILKGFDYGFIGGCTGKIAEDRLLFNGDINYHKDCNSILDFLKNYNVEPVIIENQPLFDIGSIIPLAEENTL